MPSTHSIAPGTKRPTTSHDTNLYSTEGKRDSDRPSASTLRGRQARCATRLEIHRSDTKAGWALAAKSSVPTGVQDQAPERLTPLPDELLALIAAGAATTFPVSWDGPLGSARNIFNKLSGQDVTKPLTETIEAIIVSEDFLFLWDLPPERWTHMHCLSSVKRNGQNLRDIPLKFKTPELCLAAVQQDGRALKHVPYHLRDEEICQTAIQHDGCHLLNVPMSRRSKQMCLDALRNTPVGERLGADRLQRPETIMAMIEEDGYNLLYVHESLRTPDLCLAAVRNNGAALQHVPVELRDDVLCLAAIENEPSAAAFLPAQFYDDPRMRAATVASNLRILGLD